MALRRYQFIYSQNNRYKGEEFFGGCELFSAVNLFPLGLHSVSSLVRGLPWGSFGDVQHYKHTLKTTKTCKSSWWHVLWHQMLRYVDSLSYFSFQPVLHDWHNKDHGMYYPVCSMVHIKNSLLLIIKLKNSCSGGSRFFFSR